MDNEVPDGTPQPSQGYTFVQDILLIGFIILGIWTTYKGFTFIVSSFQSLVVGLGYLLGSNLLFFLFFKDVSSQAKIVSGSIVYYLSKNNYLRIILIILLNIFAVSNFTYVIFHVHSGLPNGFQFAFSVMLSFVAYVLYKSDK